MVNTRNVSVPQNYYSSPGITSPSGPYTSPEVIQCLRFREFVQTGVDGTTLDQAFSLGRFYTRPSAVSVAGKQARGSEVLLFPEFQERHRKNMFQETHL